MLHVSEESCKADENSAGALPYLLQTCYLPSDRRILSTQQPTDRDPAFLEVIPGEIR